jgi:hypothetical protein
MLEPRDHFSTELTEDEVALFSSRSNEGEFSPLIVAEIVDEANHQIQSFSASNAVAHSSPHHGDMAAPRNMPRQSNVVGFDVGGHLGADLSSGQFSPTQLSSHVDPGLTIPTVLVARRAVTQEATTCRRQRRSHTCHIG